MYLFEIIHIAKSISCDEMKTTTDSNSVCEFIFSNGSTIETYSINSYGYVYYSVCLKDKFIAIDHKLISTNYVEWVNEIKRMNTRNLYAKLAYNLYKFVETYTDCMLKKISLAVTNI